MFPARYFPGRYFPGRYFPKIGAELPIPVGPRTLTVRSAVTPGNLTVFGGAASRNLTVKTS